MELSRKSMGDLCLSVVLGREVGDSDLEEVQDLLCKLGGVNERLSDMESRLSRLEIRMSSLSIDNSFDDLEEEEEEEEEEED